LSSGSVPGIKDKFIEGEEGAAFAVLRSVETIAAQQPTPAMRLRNSDRSI